MAHPATSHRLLARDHAALKPPSPCLPRLLALALPDECGLLDGNGRRRKPPDLSRPLGGSLATQKLGNVIWNDHRPCRPQP